MNSNFKRQINIHLKLHRSLDQWRSVKVISVLLIVGWIGLLGSSISSGKTLWSSNLQTLMVTNPANSGPGTFRQAILDAQAGSTILFDPAIFPPATPLTITFQSQLPAITTNGLTIDASNAGVILNFQNVSVGDGLVVQGAEGVTIRGLQILNSTQCGIVLDGGAHHTVIGGNRMLGAAPLGQGNLISNNVICGIMLTDIGTTNNQVEGNFIGTDITASHKLGNHAYGIYILKGASSNIIGSTRPNEQNVISGNAVFGVLVADLNTAGNQVIGNYIGTDSIGINPLANGFDGLAIIRGANNNIVGGDTPGSRNLISGNGASGIRLLDSNTVSNKVLGNYIGTDSSGMKSLSNIENGVVIVSASTNIVGGDSLGAGNLISGNRLAGVRIENNAMGNQVTGNLIGTNSTGQQALPNQIGVEIVGANNNIIGGALDKSGNHVDFNHNIGLVINNSISNTLQNNTVRYTDGIATHISLGNKLIHNQFSNNHLNSIEVEGGVLPLNETWTPQIGLDTYTIVNQDIVVPTGVSWSIDPGINIQFDFGLGANIAGNLNALGAQGSQVRFTGAQRFAAPLPGDWKGLTFNGGSAQLQNASIEFARDGIVLNGGAIDVITSTVTASEIDGIRVESGNLTIGGGNSFAGNGQYAIHNTAGGNIQAANVWWGSASGPSNLGGKGDTVSDGVSVSNPRQDPGSKNDWLNAPVLNQGEHSFLIKGEQDTHWFRVPIQTRNAIITATLTSLPKDYDIFLFSSLEKDDTSPGDIGHLRDIYGRIAFVEGCSPDYIEGLSSSGKVFNTERLLQAGCKTGIQPEEVSTDVYDQSGWYYLLVAGHNGTHDPDKPYTLKVSIEPGISDTAPFQPPVVNLLRESHSGKKTLILTNWSRLQAPSDLIGLVNSVAAQVDVAGDIIDLGDTNKYPELAGIYKTWDDHANEPYYANRLAATIKSLLSVLRGAYPDLKYLLIIGGDQVVPFRRIPDEVTIANERSYLSQVTDDIALSGSLAEGYFLSDDYYAGFSPIPWRGREIFLPEYEIGRLVETTDEIKVAIEAFLESPTLKVTNADVVGYDFMTDQASEITQNLNRVGVNTESLINNNWLKSDLINLWLNKHHDLSSINAHFNHYQAIPPAQSSSTNPEEIVSPQEVQGSPYQKGSVVFSIGCHSGLSVAGSTGNQLDFAQVLSGNGAIYIANTGYGYGDPDAIGYSERLMQIFIEQLTGAPTSVGQALREAKLTYFNELAVRSLTPYHEKVLGVATLYGFPMMRIQMPNTSPNSRTGLAKSKPKISQWSKGNACPDALICQAINLTPVYDAPHIQPNGTYYTVQGEEAPQDTLEQSIQPRASISITLDQILARGAVFEGGRYEIKHNFDPVVTRVVSQTAQTAEEAEYTIPDWRPTTWDLINSVRTPKGVQQQLVVVPAQYQYTKTLLDGGVYKFIGEERLFTEMHYTVYYSTTTDTIPPYIWSVQPISATDSIDQVHTQIQVGVNDLSKVARVLIAFTTGDGIWQTTELHQADSNYWTGNLPKTTNLDYFVQAVDHGGNVAIDDNKGRYFGSSQLEASSIYLPVILVHPPIGVSETLRKSYLPLISRNQ